MKGREGIKASNGGKSSITQATAQTHKFKSFKAPGSFSLLFTLPSPSKLAAPLSDPCGGYQTDPVNATNLCNVQIPHGGISSPLFCHTFCFCPTQPAPVITSLFQCGRTECRGTGTAAYLPGNAAPCGLCGIALTPTEETADTDFHSCSLIKLCCCEHITQIQKGTTKARLLRELKQGEERDENEGQTTQTQLCKIQRK